MNRNLPKSQLSVFLLSYCLYFRSVDISFFCLSNIYLVRLIELIFLKSDKISP